MLKLEGKYGAILLSDSVIARIVGSVATNCFGVVGMAAKNAADSFNSLLKWDNMDKGVDVTYNEQKISIGLHIIVTYGVNIPAISESIINKVKYSVEEFTGVKVDRVEIFVDLLKM